MQRSVTQNTIFMTVASVGQKIVSFVYFTLVARNIGPEETGKYFFTLSFTTLFVVFVDLGFTNVLVREAAKAREKIQEYFSTIIAAKILFGVLSYGGAIGAIWAMGYPIEIRHLVYISAITMLFDSFHLSIYGVLRALGRVGYEAISIVGSQLLTLILGSVVLFFDLPLLYLMLAFTVPSFLNMCYAATVLYRKFHIILTPHFRRDIFFHLGRMAVPFALAAVFARVYSSIDSILLSKLAGNTAVGWYSIPYKITFAFQFATLALVAALYPRFSEYFVTDKRKLAYLFERSVAYLWIVAFPIVVGICILAKDIILALYTEEYLASLLPLQILISSLLFSFVSFPIGSFLNACNRQGVQTAIVGSVMVVNVLLNIILIPRLGIVGAAVAACVGNVLLSVLGYIFIPKIASISHAFIAKTFVQLSVAAGVMGLFVWLTNQYLHFLVAIVVGACVYSTMLILTRAVTLKNIQELVQLIRYGSQPQEVIE